VLFSLNGDGSGGYSNVPEFDGSKPDEIRTWILQLRNKLAAQARIGLEEVRSLVRLTADELKTWASVRIDLNRDFSEINILLPILSNRKLKTFCFAFVTSLKAFSTHHNKLAAQAHRYPTELSKLRYAFGRLKGAAFNMVRSHLSEETGAVGFSTLNEMLAVLRQAYDDPDRAHTARIYVRGLKIEG
jgi:hypothetical protein